MTDYISRADAIEAVCRTRCGDKAKGCPAHSCLVIEEFDALPSADAVSREEYTKIDGVVTIEKQNANEVGEIKHIVIHSPNYTRYFYNESMPTSADAEQTDKIENQPRLVERNYTTEGGGGEIYHPTRQQGEWIPIEETLPTYDGGEKTWLTGMKCSNCGKLFDLLT